MNWFKAVIRNAAHFMNDHSVWVMLFLLLILSGVYNYPEILMKRPQSVHSWRQCDGASLALNYYQHGMHFFKPDVHTIYSDNWTTGYAAPSEIPILYYAVAGLYSIFGYHDYIFRFVNYLIFIIGLLYLFKLSKRVTGSDFWAGTTTILLFSSPLIIFYANNFLPNSNGLALSIAGWYYFYRYYETGKTRTFFTSVIFFILAGSMKISELSGPIIILILLLSDKVSRGKLKLWTDKDFLVKVISIVAIFALIAGWVYYAKYFNTIHKSNNFSTQTYPIWNLNFKGIRDVIQSIKYLWIPDYYMPVTLIMTGAMVLLSLAFRKKLDRIIGISTAIYLAGFSVYMLLWFDALAHHDYFLITFFIIPTFIMLNFFRYIHQSVKSKRLDIIIKAVAIVFLLLNIEYGARGNRLRYTSFVTNDLPAFRDLHTLTGYLRSIGIKPDDRVVFTPEICIRPLYLMNQPGWVLAPTNRADSGQARNDSLLLLTFLKSGADYLITNNLATVFSRKSIQAYTKQLVAQHGNVFIFKLPPEKTNFMISSKPVEKLNIRCDAENPDSTGTNLYFDDIRYAASAGGNITKDIARSGKFSVLINEERPYAFTTLIHAKPLDIIKVKVYCKSDNLNCLIACGSEGFETLYDGVIRTDSSQAGWKSLNGYFIIPSYYNSGAFHIYVWNLTGYPVYLDDFEITIERYGLYKI
jgi:hypothetical protein